MSDSKIEKVFFFMLNYRLKCDYSVVCNVQYPGLGEWHYIVDQFHKTQHEKYVRMAMIFFESIKR